MERYRQGQLKLVLDAAGLGGLALGLTRGECQIAIATTAIRLYRRDKNMDQWEGKFDELPADSVARASAVTDFEHCC